MASVQLLRANSKDGQDLVLVGRSIAPMDALAEEIKSGGANATVLPCDLSKAEAAKVLADKIEAQGFVIDVLVNAAGLGGSGRFDQPGMVLRGSGKILPAASTAAFQPGPQMAVYSATKAYVLSLGEAITFELKDTAVNVTTLCPGPTATDFARVAGIEDVTLFT